MTTKEKTLGNESIGRYDVSIIVPTYNRSEYIRECIDSLLEQTRPALEIIVVDDGSEDNTAEIIRTYGNKVRYVHKENGGKPNAVNMGISVAQGNLIWVFDDDDVALPDAIEKRVLTFKSNPYADFVYGPHYLGENEPDGSIKSTDLHKVPQYDDGLFLFELLKGCFFHLNSCLVKVEAYQEISGFDPTLLRAQDYDVQIRLARTLKGFYSPGPSFIFRQHSGVRGSKKNRHFGSERAKVFHVYDYKVGQKIRLTFNLEEYSPHKDKFIEKNERIRLALLYRMIVMASKGCILEMFEDLNEVLRNLESGSELGLQEKELITSSITTGYAYIAIRSDESGFKECINTLPISFASKQAVKAIAKGFFILAKSYPDTIIERLYKLFLSAKLLFIIQTKGITKHVS